MEVLEGLNVLVCINGRKNKLRVYYLSWLRNKIVKGDDVSYGLLCCRCYHGDVPPLLQLDSHRSRHGFSSVGELDQCIHFKVGESLLREGGREGDFVYGDSHSPLSLPLPLLSVSVQHEKMKFLCIATKSSVEVYAWAQKPYSKFMQFKSFPDIPHRPVLVDMVCETSTKTKVLYASAMGQCYRWGLLSRSVLLCCVWFPGFHAIDLENGVLQDLYLPAQGVRTTVTPHAIIPIPRSPGELLLCYNSQLK